jgi:hypothetical protein
MALGLRNIPAGVEVDYVLGNRHAIKAEGGELA